MKYNTAVGVVSSGNVLIDGLLWGGKWQQSTITFAFPTAFSQYGGNYYPSWGVGFTPFSPGWQANARYWLQQVEAITQVKFVESDPSTATLRFARYDNPSNIATGNYPMSNDYGGDMWFPNNDNANGMLGDVVMFSLFHELGHALGLKHPHDKTVNLPREYDSNTYSTMSYKQYIGAPIEGVYGRLYNNWVQSIALLDIQALQYLYGANFNYNSGDTVYTFDLTGAMFVDGKSEGPVADNSIHSSPGPGQGARILRAIWDGNGVDTYDFSNYNEDQQISLVPGQWSTFSAGQLAADSRQYVNGELVFHFEPGNIVNSLTYQGDIRSLIENVRTGAGNDFVRGNIADNRIETGLGDDVLLGGKGSDSLLGGPGTDTASYAGDEGGVFVNLTLGRGYGNASFGDTYDSIENVIGTDYNDFLIGDPGVNRLDGAGGNDTIIGAVGPDEIVGGDGIDWASYEDNSGTVFVNLTLRQGFNNAAHGDTYDGIENLVGGLFDDFFIGDEGANRLNGAMGADTLLGAGGADVFMFTYAPGATSTWGSPNVDLILDFTTGEDKIELAATAFLGLAAGALPAAAFYAGSAAHDGDDRIIYDAATGKLWFDPDGTGGQAAMLFATLGETSHPAAVAATDFVVV